MPSHRTPITLSRGTAVAALLALTACAPEPAATDEAAQDGRPRPTVIDPQLQALDKARGVESQVLDASRRPIDDADEASR